MKALWLFCISTLQFAREMARGVQCKAHPRYASQSATITPTITPLTMTIAAAPSSALSLHPHPSTPSPWGQSQPIVRALHTHIAWPRPNWLRLRYVLEADLAFINIPPTSPTPAATDGLWQHTCFEAFIGAGDDGAYHEFNFSPSGDWAIYTFVAERVRQPEPTLLPAPIIACTTTPDSLTLTADMSLHALAPNGKWRAGLSAIIELADGNKLYWALHHPKPQPDFHARSGWVADAFSPSPPTLTVYEHHSHHSPRHGG